MIIIIDKNTLRVVEVKGAVGSATKKELLHTSVDLVDFEVTLTTSAYKAVKEVLGEMLPDTKEGYAASPLVLEDWLINQKVNTRIFWKNCKIKHGGVYRKKQTLAKKDCDDWVVYAFDWDENILGLHYEELELLSDKWQVVVKEAKKVNRKVEFGFGVKS